MKKVFLILLILLSFQNVKGNSKLDSIFYIHYNLGFNNILGKGDLSLPYGVGLAEKTLGPGFGMGAGLEILLGKKWGVGISGGVGAYSTNRSKFERSLEDRFPDENFIYDDNGYFTHSLTGGVTTGWEVSLSYDFEFKKLIIRPRLSYGNISGGAVKYSYLTRIPASNLITNYSINSDANRQRQFGVGVEISPIKYRPISIYINIASSLFENDYIATINDVYGNSEEETFTSKYGVLFLNLGISIGFDIFMPKESTGS